MKLCLNLETESKAISARNDGEKKRRRHIAMQWDDGKSIDDARVFNQPEQHANETEHLRHIRRRRRCR